MATSVLSQAAAASTGTATPTITLGSDPTGQTVYIAVNQARGSTARAVSSVAGAGATWTQEYVDSQNRLTVYKGVGATSTGPVTVTLSGTTSNITALGAWVVSGVPSGAVVFGTSRFLSTVTTATPTALSPRVGEPVFAITNSTSTPTFPSSSEPSTGWTTTTNGNSAVAYQIASAEARHVVTATQASAGSLAVAEFIVAVPSRYWHKFRALNPTEYYRLNETTGTTVYSLGPRVDALPDMNLSGTYTLAAPGGMPSGDTAINFAGTGNGATTGTSGSTYGTERTFIAWVKIASAPGSNRVMAYGSGYAAASSIIWGLGATASGVATCQPGQSGVFLDGTSNICDDKWHMLAVTVEADNLGRLYVDGVLEATSASAVTVNTQVSRMYLGRYDSTAWGASGIYWPGLVDEAGATAAALTGAQIAELYLWGKRYSGEVMSYAPFAYYRLNESSGTALADSSGNNRTVTSAGTSAAQYGVTGALINDINKAIRWGDGPEFLYTAGGAAVTRTLIAWINSNAAGASGPTNLLAGTYYYGNGTNYFGLFLASGKPRGNINGSVIDGATSVNNNQWHMMALTFEDAGGVMRLYVDGAQVATTSGVSIQTLSDRIRVGGDWPTETRSTLDEVSYLTQTLTGAQIASLYTAGSGIVPPPQVTAAQTGSGAFTATATVVVPEVFTRTANLTGTGTLKARAMRGDWGPNLFPDPQFTGPGDPYWSGLTATTSLPSGVPLGYTSGAYIDNSTIASGGGLSGSVYGVQVQAGRPITVGTWVRVVNDPGWTGFARVNLAMWTDNTTWTDYYDVAHVDVQESEGWTWVEIPLPNPQPGYLWPMLEPGAFNTTLGPGGGKTRVYTTGVEIRQQVDAVVTAPLTGSGAFTATTVENEVVTASLTGSGAFTATASGGGPPSVAAALTGTGDYTAASVQVAVRTADLAGAGSFAATATAVTIIPAVAAPLTGVGIFSASTVQGDVRSASLVGAGDFTATATKVVVVTAVTGNLQTATGTVLDGEVSTPAPATLTIFDPTVEQPPATLTVGLSGVEPLTLATFQIDDVVVATETSDVEGNVVVLTIPVSRDFLAGSHILTAITAAHTASGTFTITTSADSLPPTQNPDAPPVPVDGTVGDNGVYRWVLQDRAPGGIGSWIMPLNPTSMGNPHVRKSVGVVTTTTVHARPHVSEGAAPVEWQFAGFAPDKAFQDKLLAYRDLRYRFYLIDHRNRAWVVSFVAVELVPRKRHLDANTGQPTDWMADYTVQAVLYSQTPQEVLA